MRKFSDNLGFRLISASIILAFATIFVAGYFVYNQSQVSIENNSLMMVREIALSVAEPEASGRYEDYLRRYLTSKSGGAWLMNRDGSILASTYPRFAGAVPTDTTFGSMSFRLQRAEKLIKFGETKRTDVHLVTPRQIIEKYEEGIAEYDYLGTTRIVAFKVIPENGWLIGVEKPVGVAYSELQNIKKYIAIVCIISVIMVSLFSWLAIDKIIQPFYKDVENLNARLGDSVRRLSTLHKVSRSIQRLLPLEQMLGESIKGIAEALGYERILLHLINQETGKAELEMALVGNQVVSPDQVPEEIRSLSSKKEDGVIERAMAEQKYYHIKNAMTSDIVNKDRARALEVREFAVVPLIAESKCIGAITVDNPSGEMHIHGDDIDTLMTFAGHVGLAIERSHLHAELHNYAVDAAQTDSLTGLFNWGHLIAWLEKELEKSIKQRSPLSVIWVHARSLKAINEEFGYIAGNISIRRLGQLIGSLVGKGEAGARFGGGEFVIGIPDCAEDRAAELVEELKNGVRELRFEEEGLEKTELEITVSVNRFIEGESMPDFLERARKQAASQ
jgi:diguanylate cyclase (GGDEF)-like protein